MKQGGAINNPTSSACASDTVGLCDEQRDQRVQLISLMSRLVMDLFLGALPITPFDPLQDVFSKSSLGS
jgi:hypothetical protein